MVIFRWCVIFIYITLLSCTTLQIFSATPRRTSHEYHLGPQSLSLCIGDRFGLLTLVQLHRYVPLLYAWRLTLGHSHGLSFRLS